ncbi:MAG: BACON domain-containing carbohydrate-binding protein [Porphyromonas sp.]|nr:BACON domain-containing carbohydrate-binding protein [Porphyromonas sp.]
MKANRYIALACAVLALGLASCGESQDAPAAVAEVSVVETNFDQAYTASKGRITVDQEGFEVKTDATWLQAVKDGPKSIALTIEKNEAAESRTANVIITKGQTVQRVPITQLGVVNVMTLSDIEAQRQGSEHSFAIDKMDSEPTITASHDWITATVEDKVLKIRVAPFASGETEDRRGTVRVVAGLFDRTINVSQTYGVVAYADLLGEYDVVYTPEHNLGTRNIVLTLVQKEVGKSFTLKGLSLDITVLFDAKVAGLIIPTGEQTGGQGLAEGEKLFLAGWGGGYPNASGQPDWDLNWNNPGETALQHYGTWNKSFDQPVFTFAPKGFGDKSRPILGLFVLKADGGFKGWYNPTGDKAFTIGHATWTKKLASS